jgi:hypothetical protein
LHGLDGAADGGDRVTDEDFVIFLHLIVSKFLICPGPHFLIQRPVFGFISLSGEQAGILYKYFLFFIF